MLLIFLSWLYILFVSYAYGHALISLLKNIIGSKAKLHFSLYVLCGFAVLTAVTTFISLFLNIALAVNVVVFTLALLYVVGRRKAVGENIKSYYVAVKEAPRLTYVAFLVAVVLALVLSAFPDAKYDNGLYYQQTIKWIQTYPAITGLGNLHLKFSFNSGWHVLTALFSFTFLGLQLHDLNGLLFVLLVVFALDGLKNILNNSYRFSDVFKVVTIAPLHLLFSYMVSPSPDLVIPYILWVIFTLFLQKIESAQLELFDAKSLIILVLSMFAVVIKLSAIPIVLLPLYLIYLQLRKNNYRVLLPAIALAFMMIAPWVARSVIISGYLVYPLYQLDVLAVDWKVPAELVKLEVIETQSFAKVRHLPFTEVMQLSLTEWLPKWYAELQTSEKLLVFLIFSLLVATPFIVLYKVVIKKINQQKIGIIILLLSLYAGIGFWFFTAPHFRYGMGFSVGLYLLALSYLLYRFALRFPGLRAPLFGVLILAFFSKPAAEVIIWYQEYPGDYLVHPKEALVTGYKQVKYHGIDIYIPETSAKCWDAPLPCAPFVVDGLELRTGSIRDGFRIKEPKPEVYRQKRLESMKIQGITHNILL